MEAEASRSSLSATAQTACQVPLVRPVPLVRLVRRGRLVLLAPPGQVDLLVLLARLGLLERLERRVLLVLPVHPVLPVHRALLAPQGLLVRRASRRSSQSRPVLVLISSRLRSTAFRQSSRFPGLPKPCVNLVKTATMGPLPSDFKVGSTVKVSTRGKSQTVKVGAGRKIKLNTSNLQCSTYAIAIRSVTTPKQRPAWRIWQFTGGHGLIRFWFPGAPLVSNF